jgi:hypothetical protein
MPTSSTGMWPEHKILVKLLSEQAHQQFTQNINISYGEWHEMLHLDVMTRKKFKACSMQQQVEDKFLLRV